MVLFFYHTSATPPLNGQYANRYWEDGVAGPMSREEVKRIATYLPGTILEIETYFDTPMEFIKFFQERKLRVEDPENVSMQDMMKEMAADDFDWLDATKGSRKKVDVIEVYKVFLENKKNSLK